MQIGGFIFTICFLLEPLPVIDKRNHRAAQVESNEALLSWCKAEKPYAEPFNFCFPFAREKKEKGGWIKISSKSDLAFSSEIIDLLYLVLPVKH